MTQQVYNFSPFGFFRIGTNELEAFRNGIKLINVLNYTEITRTEILILETVSTGDIIEGQVRGRQLGAHPGLYKFIEQLTPIAGGDFILYTIPEYTVGNNSLKIWRNGKLLSLSNGDYEEPFNTVVKIPGPLSTLSSDTFEFVVRGQNFSGEPLLFEEISATGGTNEVFTLADDYIVNSRTLEVYRNGKKLVFAFGYNELTTTTIRHNGVSDPGDTFTFMVRAEAAVEGLTIC